MKPTVPDIPIELQAVFRRHSDAKAIFDRSSPSHKREYVTYILDAKKPETRMRRADRVVVMLTGKKLQTVYQPKTIPEVFGLQTEMKTQVVNPPKDYIQIMSGWQMKNSTPPLDFAHLFVTTQVELEKWLPILKSQLRPNGMIWVSWPKQTAIKGGLIKASVREHNVRTSALAHGLVDIKVCAVSDVWSGLKLMIPRAKRV